MKKFGLVGIGNAIMDLLVHVSEEEFGALGLKKAGMQLVDASEQAELLSKIAKGEGPAAKSGGSVANSIIAFTQLGGKSAFLGCVTADEFGSRYRQEMEQLGIEFPAADLESGATASSLILVTPDAERTMNTCLGTASNFTETQVSEEIIKESEWLLIEGYLLANPENGVAAVRKAVEYAKAHGTKIAFTCSDAWVVSSCEAAIKELLPNLDLIVANAEEAITLAGEADAKVAFEKLTTMVPLVAVTLGGEGVLVGDKEAQTQVEAFDCTPEDLTGAGDAFLGTFLYGLMSGQSRELAARKGCFVASKVISQLGPRLESPAVVLKDLKGIQKAA